MKAYKWDEQYDVGFNPIDSQHKSILRLINRLLLNRHRNKKIMVGLLDELICYVQYHFKSEENYMILLRYPEYKSHLIEHASLMKDIIGITDKYKEDKVSIVVICDSLLNWAMPHILEVDKIVGMFLEKAKNKKRE